LLLSPDRVSIFPLAGIVIVCRFSLLPVCVSVFERHNVKGHFVAIKMLCHARDEVKRAATGAREIISLPPQTTHTIYTVFFIYISDMDLYMYMAQSYSVQVQGRTLKLSTL